MKSSAVFAMAPCYRRKLHNALKGTIAEDHHVSAEGYFLKCLALLPRIQRRPRVGYSY